MSSDGSLLYSNEEILLKRVLSLRAELADTRFLHKDRNCPYLRARLHDLITFSERMQAVIHELLAEIEK